MRLAGNGQERQESKKKKKKNDGQALFSVKPQKAPSKRAKAHNRVPPGKPRNRDVRSREYLTGDEIRRLKDAARSMGRHGFRDWLLITMMYRHAFRVGEAVDLKHDQVNLTAAKLHVNRLKNGDPSVHYLEGAELRALSRQLFWLYADSPFVFALAIKRPCHGRARRPRCRHQLSVHPHMLRHSKGYQLTSKGIDTRAIQSSTQWHIQSLIRADSKDLETISSYFFVTTLPSMSSLQPKRILSEISLYFLQKNQHFATIFFVRFPEVAQCPYSIKFLP